MKKMPFWGFSLKSGAAGVMAGLLLAGSSSIYGQTNGTWSADAAGNWHDSVNWVSGAIADGAGATADFSTLNLTAARTVTIDGAVADRTVGTLLVGDTTTTTFGYTFAGTGTTPTLHFNNNGSNAVLTQTAASGANTFASSLAIELDDHLDITNNSSANRLFFNGVISDNTGRLITIKAAGGPAASVVFSNLTNSFNGGITVENGGVLGAQGGTGSNFGTGTITLKQGSALSTSGSTNIFLTGNNAQVWDGDFTVNTNALVLSMGNGAVTLTGNRTLNVTGTSQFRVGGIISDGGNGYGLTKDGTATSTLALSGANEYTGTTTISAGTLQLGAGGAGGSLHLSSAIVNNGTFAVNQSDTVTQGVDFATVISGTGGVTMAGTTAGILVLNGANTYEGATRITAGTLSVASFNSVVGGTASSNLGKPLTVANGTISIGATTVAGTLTYTGAGETTDRVLNLAGTTGGATINQSGTGLLKFSSDLTTTGNGAKTLTLQGSTAGIGEIGGAIVNSTSATAVTKNGTGTWVLSGANTYTGTTTISGGSLQLGNGGTTGSLATTGAIVNNANLTINRSNAVVQGTDFSSAAITGTGSFTQAGSGTTTLNAANTYSGATTITGGTLVISSTGTINNTSGVVVSTGGTFKYNSSTAYTGGAINNAGGSVGGSGNLGSTVLGGTGSIDPGNSPGIMTAAGTDPAGGLDYNFEYTVANAAPTWSNTAASGNDVLRLTSGTTPFSSALDSDNLVSLYLGVSSLSAGDVFLGGFFTDLSADFTASLASASTAFYVLGDGGGSNFYNGVGYYTLAQYNNTLAFDIDTVLVGLADFSSGSVANGYVMELTAVVAVPEPATWALMVAGLGTLWILRRRGQGAS